MSGTPDWQCVMILWGTKYPVDLVNHQVRMIRALSGRPARFVLITDRPREGLDPDIAEVAFDPFFLAPEFKGPGCQAKLTMFVPGLVPTDLPAVFVDLDTVIVGDLSRVVDTLDRRDRVRILQSAILPFGPLGRLAYRLSGGKRYARGNSSVVLWHPAQGAEVIAARFRALYEEHGGLGIRPMIADERFISWCVQPRMGAVPKSVAVKFPNEFMHPIRAWISLKGRLPWVRARRAGLAAVTLPGEDIKPERLLALGDGEAIQDRKGRWLIWSETALGGLKEQIRSYYRDRPDIG
ncbi:hypothetical protein GQ651_04190 [Alphaproteobacteria bacterium GH1-50]|uniref:Glycosyl transferase family 8 n=1 Tax=Kangsaoukella pontilimi TaxID=2691042 RepID=A0A7C9J1S5_9RHOB|nr:hypothetical protein [Kangsaoukella pontilimi]MXQ07041.1 hypothetical protein [Kangsaoukella pontilimi]